MDRYNIYERGADNVPEPSWKQYGDGYDEADDRPSGEVNPDAEYDGAVERRLAERRLKEKKEKRRQGGGRGR